MTRCSISSDTCPLESVPATLNEPAEGPLTSKAPGAVKLLSTAWLLSLSNSLTMRPEKVTKHPVNLGFETSTLIFPLPRSWKRWFKLPISEHVGADSWTVVEV